MSLFKQGRYSGYLRPISYFIDLSIIYVLAILYFFKNVETFNYILIMGFCWVVISMASKFYEVYRFTREVTILTLIIRQAILFLLLVFAYFGYHKNYQISPKIVFYYVLSSFFLIGLFKFTVYYTLQRYRSSFGGNFRRTIILGKNNRTKALEHFFNKNPEYGYQHQKTISIDEDENFEELFKYIQENVDEVYCSLSELSNSQLVKVIDFADNNLKLVKFLPDNKEVYSKRLKYQYYDYIPILSLRTIPIEDSFNRALKRVFDILFSSIVIILLLSWLTPLLAILIRLESKGSVFFKQTRNGFNYEEFDCYKFRSMTQNREAHLKQATKNDQRVTRVGKFIRKTSIDELPQFFNVLFGDMSVVGPRPHMVSHTNDYAKRIDKFMVRHLVKPGITGLAQVKGFRGEIETDKDIINRVKYDIFYIENWSLLLDLKIIFQTINNTIKGEEKAY